MFVHGMGFQGGTGLPWPTVDRPQPMERTALPSKCTAKSARECEKPERWDISCAGWLGLSFSISVEIRKKAVRRRPFRRLGVARL